MVIWTTVINHCESDISLHPRQMNDQSKAVSFHPKDTRLFVPTLAFTHGRTPSFCGRVRRLARQARVGAARSGWSMTSARANAAMQA
jgi:hypothetical protein